jgi:two-component sensor histidine kinase
MPLANNVFSTHLSIQDMRVWRINIILLVVFSLFFCLKPPTLYAQKEVNYSLMAKSLQELPIDSSFAWMSRNKSEDDLNVHEIGLQILRRAYNTQQDSLIAYAHVLQSDWHSLTNAFSTDSVLYHSIKAVEYYEKAGDKRKIAEYSRVLSIDYLNSIQYDKAQEALFRALEIYEDLGDEKGIGGAYRSLGTIAIFMEEPELSIKYGNKARELLEKVEDYNTLTLVYLDYIKSYGLLGQYDKAYQAAADCIEMVETKAPEQIFVATRAYAARGNLSIKLEDYEWALQDYTTAWKIVEAEVGTKRALGWQIEVGIAYRYLERYEDALAHLLPGVKWLEDTDGYNILKYYEAIAECYKGLGDLPKALEYQEKSMVVKDKMQEEKIASLESEAIAKYESGKKDQLLASQEAELAQKTYIQRLTMGGLSMMALLLFTLFYFFRKNQKTNTQLSIKNQENELLLKEIHHRVKNNLEMVSSLLKLQSVKTKDAEAKGVMEASQNRVQSMGIIHQKLYQGENLASIEMKDYFQNLSENLLDAFGVSEKVNIKYDMEAVELDVDTAIPIGLIVNELLTNALKYAFPGDQKGEIELSLKETEQNKLHLLVADNGIGQSDPTTVKGTGFGSQLVKLLTMQLQGKMKASYENGTRLSFWLEKANIA